MNTQVESLSKKALEYIYNFFEQKGEDFLVHDYEYVLRGVKAFKEISKNEGLSKEEIEIAKLVVAFKDVGIINSEKPELNNQLIIDNFLNTLELTSQQLKEFMYLMNLVRNSKIPKTKLERALKDSVDIHLALPDALETISLLRMERERVYGKAYDDINWIELCRRYFITHNFHTDYAKRKYGSQRNKNFLELSRFLYKIKNDQQKQNKNAKSEVADAALNFKETEDLFKIAFRNYVDLVTVADQKARLMIQVNSIIVSVIFAFTVSHLSNHPLFLMPVIVILIIALVTIFFAILASRPQEEVQKNTGLNSNEVFFFGSFDRIDNDFIKTTWSDYKTSMRNITNGNKGEVMRQITEETFIVRKVLAQKFKYISLSYKVFTYGLMLAILSFSICYLLSI